MLSTNVWRKFLHDASKFAFGDQPIVFVVEDQIDQVDVFRRNILVDHSNQLQNQKNTMSSIYAQIQRTGIFTYYTTVIILN